MPRTQYSSSVCILVGSSGALCRCRFLYHGGFSGEGRCQTYTPPYMVPLDGALFLTMDTSVATVEHPDDVQDGTFQKMVWLPFGSLNLFLR